MAEKAKDTESSLVKTMPVILAGTSNFKPSPLMQRVLWLYVMQSQNDIQQALKELGVEGRGPENRVSMPQICVALGHSRNNYYEWLSKDGFKDWKFSAITSLLEKDMLQKIHLNLADRATTTHDAGMIKLALQRFDKDFVPRSATSARHEFAGYEPGDAEEQNRAADESRRRQRDAMAARQGDTVVPPGGFSPVIEEESTARETKRCEAER